MTRVSAKIVIIYIIIFACLVFHEKLLCYDNSVKDIIEINPFLCNESWRVTRIAL